MSPKKQIESEGGVVATDSKVKSFDISNPNDTMHLANDLARFISENKLFHNIQGKEYVNVEGWQYAGSRLGIMPIVEELTSIGEDGEIKYQSKVKLFDLRTSHIVGTGFAICSNKEATKRYYQEFAIASMAQTRAIGKAYRNILAWIIRAAGYEPTPAEEMDYAGAAASPRQEPAAIVNKFTNELPAVNRASEIVEQKATYKQKLDLQEITSSDLFTEEERVGLLKEMDKMSTSTAARFLTNQRAVLSNRVDKSLEAPEDQSQDANPITIQQKTQILLLLNNSAITKEEKEKMVVKIGSFSTIRADSAIDTLKNVIQNRTESAKAK